MNYFLCFGDHSYNLSERWGRGEICGGFKLIQTIDEITLWDIVGIMEGVDICRHLAESSKKEIVLLHECDKTNEHLRGDFQNIQLENYLDYEFGLKYH